MADPVDRTWQVMILLTPDGLRDSVISPKSLFLNAANRLADQFAQMHAADPEATYRVSIERITDTAPHTKAYTDGADGRRIAYCVEDSEAAQEWVSWPCPAILARIAPSDPATDTGGEGHG